VLRPNPSPSIDSCKVEHGHDWLTPTPLRPTTRRCLIYRLRVRSLRLTSKRVKPLPLSPTLEPMDTYNLGTPTYQPTLEPRPRSWDLVDPPLYDFFIVIEEQSKDPVGRHITSPALLHIYFRGQQNVTAPGYSSIGGSQHRHDWNDSGDRNHGSKAHRGGGER